MAMNLFIFALFHVFAYELGDFHGHRTQPLFSVHTHFDEHRLSDKKASPPAVGPG